jgi:hypothetical protein
MTALFVHKNRSYNSSMFVQDDRLGIRLSSQQKARIKAKAQAASMSISQLILFKTLGDEPSNAVPAPAKPSKPAQAVTNPQNTPPEAAPDHTPPPPEPASSLDLPPDLIDEEDEDILRAAARAAVQAKKPAPEAIQTHIETESPSATPQSERCPNCNMYRKMCYCPTPGQKCPRCNLLYPNKCVCSPWDRVQTGNSTTLDEEIHCQDHHESP